MPEAQIREAVCDFNHRIGVSACARMAYRFSRSERRICFADRDTRGRLRSRMPTDCQSMRLVVQHVWESSSGRSSYRLVGYSDEHTYRPVDFDSLDDLLKVFKTALPTFDVSSFPQAREGASSILFAEVIELSEKQRSILGLEK